MTKKNIWILCNYASPPKYASFGFRQFFFAKELNLLGHKTLIISSSFNQYMYDYPILDQSFTKENIEGVDFLWVKTNKYANPHSFGRILNWLIFTIKSIFISTKDNITPDIIYCSVPSHISFLACTFLKLRFPKVRIHLEVRDIWPLTLTEIGNKSKYNPMIFALRLIEKISYKFSDMVIGTMPLLNKHINSSISSKFKYHYFPQGIDLNFMKKSKNFDCKDFFSLPNDKFIIGYAGSISVANALETLIKAANDIAEVNDNIHFCILGDGLEKEKLKKLAGNLKNVTFYNKISKKYVWSFLNKCNVLYDSVKSCKIYNFGISRNKWMDYMFSSKPLIVSYDGYENIISKIGNGIVVPPENVHCLKDAILKLSSFSKIELKKMSVKGYEFVTKERSYKKLTASYSKKIL